MEEEEKRENNRWEWDGEDGKIGIEELAGWKEVERKRVGKEKKKEL